MNTETEHIAAIREGVRDLCSNYSEQYWLELDSSRGYPTEFVSALTEAGYLSAAI